MGNAIKHKNKIYPYFYRGIFIVFIFLYYLPPLLIFIKNDIPYNDIIINIENNFSIYTYRLSRKYFDENSSIFEFERTWGSIVDEHNTIFTALITCTYNNGEWQVSSEQYGVETPAQS